MTGGSGQMVLELFEVANCDLKRKLAEARKVNKGMFRNGNGKAEIFTGERVAGSDTTMIDGYYQF